MYPPLAQTMWHLTADQVAVITLAIQLLGGVFSAGFFYATQRNTRTRVDKHEERLDKHDDLITRHGEDLAALKDRPRAHAAAR